MDNHNNILENKNKFKRQFNRFKYRLRKNENERKKFNENHGYGSNCNENFCYNSHKMLKERNKAWRKYYLAEENLDFYRYKMDKLNEYIKEQKKKYPKIVPNYIFEILKEYELKIESECTICFTKLSEETYKIINPCCHRLCKICFEKIYNTTKACPICREVIID